MLVNFGNRELEVIRELAKRLEISEEKVVVHALRVFQLEHFKAITEFSESPGCGIID